MTSNSRFMVEGEHDEVMTIRVNQKQSHQNTFTSGDPLLCSSQSQDANSFIKDKTQSIDISITSNGNEKDIWDNQDELTEFIENVLKEDQGQNTNVQKEHIEPQAQQPNVKSCQIDNKAQVIGTNEIQQLDKAAIHTNEVLAYLAIPSCSLINTQDPQDQGYSVQIPENVAQIGETERISQDHDQIVLTPCNAAQNVDKQVIHGSDATQIVLNSGNATQVVQQQGIPVQHTVLLSTQGFQVQKGFPPVYFISDPTVKSSIFDTSSKQLSDIQICNKQMITRNNSQDSSLTQKRSYQEEGNEDNDNDHKDIQMKKKIKMIDTKTNKKVKKWEIAVELEDPVEEQKRLKAKKAREHREKEKKEKEEMKNMIKSQEECIKRLESELRIVNAEKTTLQKLLKIR